MAPTGLKRSQGLRTSLPGQHAGRSMRASSPCCAGLERSSTVNKRWSQSRLSRTTTKTFASCAQITRKLGISAARLKTAAGLSYSKGSGVRLKLSTVAGSRGARSSMRPQLMRGTGAVRYATPHLLSLPVVVQPAQPNLRQSGQDVSPRAQRKELDRNGNLPMPSSLRRNPQRLEPAIHERTAKVVTSLMLMASRFVSATMQRTLATILIASEHMHARSAWTLIAMMSAPSEHRKLGARLRSTA